MGAIRGTSTITEKPPLTVTEFQGMPESYGRYELIDGRLVEKPVVKIRHGRIAHRLNKAYDNFDPNENKGEMLPDINFYLREDYSPAPDVSYWIAERRAAEEAPIAPYSDFAVEVQSPDQSLPSLRKKIREYLSVGVRLVWLVIPSKRTIEIYRLGEANVEIVGLGATLDFGDIIPDFTVTTDELFRQ
jgi:Uma2 family endonuclease